MNVLVCYKLSPDAEDIQVQPDGSLSFANVEWRIGQYDLIAVETGAQLVEAYGGTLTALSVGPIELKNSKARKAILSRGPDDLILVVDEGLRDADAYTTAQALAGAIRKRGAFDLVLCGEGSADLYAQQVGVQLGQMLSVPTVNAVGKITLSGDNLIIERILEDEIEILEVSLPAVISVTTDISLPRIPGMREILAANKKPVIEWTLADLGLSSVRSSIEVISTHAPQKAKRKCIIREGESEEVVHALLFDLQKEGVV